MHSRSDKQKIQSLTIKPLLSQLPGNQIIFHIKSYLLHSGSQQHKVELVTCADG